MSLLVSLFSPLPAVIIGFLCLLLAIYVLKSHFRSGGIDSGLFNEDEEPKIKIDPAKALATQVKFVMRLKRKMKRFKERKNAEKDSNRTFMAQDQRDT
jgi:hypothetical protein